MAALDRLHRGDGGTDRVLLEPVAAGIADPLARHAAKAEAGARLAAGHLEPAVLEGQLLLVSRLEEQLAIVHGQQPVGGQRAQPVRIQAIGQRDRRVSRKIAHVVPDSRLPDGASDRG